MTRLFGTDGIRGLANSYPITPEMGIKLGRAVVDYCRRNGAPRSVVIGRDTRGSGHMLSYALASGVLSAGATALLAGQVPTPGVAYLVRCLGAGSGIVVSASHNPHDYNGFKLFFAGGIKLSEREEGLMEEIIATSQGPLPGTAAGRAERVENAWRQYADFLTDTFPAHQTLKGVKLVLDCANGATSEIAPGLFQRLGAAVIPLFTRPDGININDRCGSQHPEALRHEVLKTEAQAGLAFDGDGDRVVAVDEKGSILSGDQILAICAWMLNEQGKLRNRMVVSTVMSNVGLQFALKDMGIRHVTSRVGDRFVVETMKEKGAVLGGENSGHIIFLDHHTTGDGMVSSLQLLSAMLLSGKSLSELGGMMTIFPQVLINVPVRDKPDLTTVPELQKVIRKVEKALGGRGRTLVRYSGTEPLCRVMVEGENGEDVKQYAGEIAEAVRRYLGYSNSSDSSAG